jgi:2-polyprenyl-3-methyl-5-hydroxy-6-metoxy-1,4-benzoquinol methylase
MIDKYILKTQQKSFNEKYFKVYENDFSRERMYKDEIKRIHKFCDNGRILDVGCGIGKFLNFFDKKKWERYGVEISDYAIMESRKLGIKIKDKDQYDYDNDFFDVIVFRGSLQLIPNPFQVIINCSKLLKKGGLMIFLSTPNSNSPYYRRFGTLPMLTPHHNYLIPSDVMIRNALQNFGFKIAKIHYPYLKGPYSRPIRDILFYFISFFGIKYKFAFYKSMMELYAVKIV